VDKDRIGIIGHSHGAYGTLFAMIGDERLKAGVISCGFTTLRTDPTPQRWWRMTALMPRLSYYQGAIEQTPIDFHLWLALVAPLVLRERLSRVALLALVPGAIGVAFVALTGLEGGERFSPIAVLAGLGSAATYAAFVVGSKRLLRARLDPLSLTFWDTLAGAAVVAPLLLATDRVLPESLGDWAAVLALGAVFSGIATLVYAMILRRITAQTAGILTFLEPVSAVLLAALLLGQSIGAGTIVGGTLVLVSGALVIGFEPGDAESAGHAAPVGSSAP